MNAGQRAGRLIEESESAGESEVGVIGNEAGEPGDGLCDEDGPGLGVAHFGGVLGIGEKGELGGAGFRHAGDTGDLQVAIPFQAAPESAGNLAEFHCVQSEFPGYRSRRENRSSNRPV